MKLGVKARWMDADLMAKLDVALMEVFIGERDLELHRQKMIDTFSRISNERAIELVVHCQEYWTDGENYHLVDLSSIDEGLRLSAIKTVRKTLDFASEIDASYVIVHPGGTAPHTIKSGKLLPKLKKSLKELRDPRILVEKMPWFYFMRDGSIWKSNICISADDFFFFSDLTGGMTLDVCHAYLSTKEGGNKYIRDMKNTLKDMIKHVHASDAKPPHHEGLQIGEGDIDFSVLCEINVGIIPEIIHGHKNGGEGFKMAIKRLRSYGF